MAKAIKFSDYRERVIDADSIDVEMPDGSTITIPPPEAWPGKMPRSDEASAKLILGDDGWKRWLDAGGNVRLLFRVIAERHKLDVGESGASSSS